MIQRCTAEYLDDVVTLHKEVLGHTLNSRIGTWFLRKLYLQTVLSSENGICYIFKEDSKILGFISLCRDHHRLDREIRESLSFQDKYRTGLTILAHPSLWAGLVRQLLFSRYLRTTYPGLYPLILTLGVAKNQQGQGVGSLLIQKAVEVSREWGVRELFVDTEVTNAAAITTYQKNGFQRVSVQYGNILLKHT